MLWSKTDLSYPAYSNRQCKTDINLRPVYHHKDDNSDAHLFLGLLAYWIVNTIHDEPQKFFV